MPDAILEIRNLCKEFPGVKALDQVNLTIHKGETLAIVGENGAGKSTLFKVISGIYQADSGEIYFEGTPFCARSPLKAQQRGISIVHQELNLAENLNIPENIFLGRPFTKKVLGIDFMDFEAQTRRAAELMRTLDMDLSLREPVRNFSVAQKQVIEIAKAISMDSKIIFFDEPSATLTAKELDKLFEIIAALKAKGVSIVYVSHRLDEVFRIADRVSVLRDGKHVITKAAADLTKEDLIRHMVGRPLAGTSRKADAKLGPEILKLQQVSSKKLQDINFSLHRGEILGIAGLVGSGRSSLAKTICGVHPIQTGSIQIDGKQCLLKCVTDAVSKGIALVPEERKQEGLILDMTVRENLTIATLGKCFPSVLIHRARENQIADKHIAKLRIVTPNAQQRVKNLSGGNQQKVALGKWLDADLNVLIFDEPTRGIDVGAKQEIYALLRSLLDTGLSIILISSELPEIVSLCNRVLVMHDGRITGELHGDQVTQERIMELAIL